MAVIKEYRCLEPECGRIFDSVIPSCIHCGSTRIKRIYVTPFAFKSDKTKLNDDNIDALTREYGMTDFSNNESTKHSPDSGSSWKSIDEITPTIQSVKGHSFDPKRVNEGAITAAGSLIQPDPGRLETLVKTNPKGIPQ